MRIGEVARSIASIVLVGMQFACLFLLIISGPLFKFNQYIILLESFSVILALWAIGVMQASKLNVFPDIRQGAILIRKGPYRIIRHPMYLAVIIFALSLLLMRFTGFRLITFLVLVVDLVMKIEYEESLLIKEFKEYKKYRAKSYKLIPFLY